MKKLFPILLIALMLSGCLIDRGMELADPAKAEKIVDQTMEVADKSLIRIFYPTYGYTFMLIALELNSNISSLIIDKTKEKVVGYSSKVVKQITPGGFLFVIPPKITDGETYYYDEDMGRMIRNYLATGEYGIPVSTPDDAEYIVVVNVRESLSKFYGLNYSEVAFSIMDKYDIPVYLANIRVESKSDRNFWYYATKKAKPVKQLTMKGLAEIMAKGLPAAHGDPQSFIGKAVKYAKESKKENLPETPIEEN